MENPNSKLKKIIQFCQKWTLPFCGVTILIGVFIMFAESIKGTNVSIVNMSNFVGIILGIVATTTSVVSIILSFYNLEKSEEFNREQERALIEMTNIQKSIQEGIHSIDEKTSAQYQSTKTTVDFNSSPKDKNDWKENE